MSVWVRSCLHVALAVAIARDVRAADAVFDAEYWEAAAEIERVDDIGACEDSVASLRRAVRSTAATNVVSYELRVGDPADVGDYQLWARVRTPADTSRTILVGQEVGGSFSSPADAFVITSGPGESEYRWLRVTRQGAGTAGNPEDDPWLVALSETPSTLELRLVESDLFLDRLAVSNAGGYTPPSCPPFVPSGDGGRPGDGLDWIPGAIDAGCEPPEYYDVRARRCLVPAESGCAATPVVLWPVALLGLRRKRPA